MKTGTFPKRIFKKKANLILAIVILFVLGAGTFAVSVRARNARAKDSGESIIQSVTVTKGSISNTIDASGNLEVSETIDITVPTGIKVDEIKAESGEEVTEGQTLAKLNKTSVTRLLVEVKDSLESIEDELDNSNLSSLEKEQLNGEKAELEETEELLTSLYKKPVITASVSGIIGAVNISENSETSNNTASSDSGSSAGQNSNSTSQMSAESTSGDRPALLFLTADISADTSDDTEGNPNHAEDNSDEPSQLKTVTDYSALSIQAPVTGASPQKNIPETSMYTGTISWDLNGGVFQGGTVYTATIVLTAKNGYTFSEKNLPIIKDAAFNWNINHTGEGNTIKIVAKYEKTSDTPSGQDNAPDLSDSGDSSDSSKTEDKSSNTAGSNSEDKTDSSGNKNSSSAGKSGSKSGASSGNISGGASSNGTASDSSSEYSAYETVAFTIASQDYAKIIVNVDELDILSVEEEQSAAVTLDALENESYTSSKSKLLNNIVICLGGMASEQVFLGEFENGNTSDLAKATDIANRMITQYGMSSLGFAQITNTSGEIAVLVQNEINKILDDCFKKAVELITENKKKMENAVKYLMQNKEIDETQFIEHFEEKNKKVSKDTKPMKKNKKS